jgi:nitrate reductase beta subunit
MAKNTYYDRMSSLVGKWCVCGPNIESEKPTVAPQPIIRRINMAHVIEGPT